MFYVTLLGKNKIVPLNVHSTQFGYLNVFTLRWFKQWGIKKESEKKQRVRKREQIGDKIEGELLPMEHTERRGNKTVTVIKETPCAYVSDLKEQIISYVDDCDSQDYASYS